MAIYHLHSKVISRSSGQTSVASAAYRSGEKLEDRRIGQTFDYTRKQEIIHTEILAPKNSPDWVNSREYLWNEVEFSEKRKDAQLAREIEVSLPRELSKEQNIELVRAFVNENFINQGMIADIAIHDPKAEDGKKNTHAHIMLTMRAITPEGLNKKKNRDWNKKETLEVWRKNWAEMTNDALSSAGSSETIDHRTLEAQGIHREATFHLGHEIVAMERKGIITAVKERFNEILKNNKYLNMVFDSAKRGAKIATTTQQQLFEKMKQVTQGREEPELVHQVHDKGGGWER